MQYATAIMEAQKRQTLLNIVRIRYGDAPTFLSVNQVIASYTLEQGSDFGVNLYPNARPGNYATGLGRLNLEDRPTITFAPLAGEQLARTAIRPLSPASLLPVAEGALPIDVLFRLAVQSIGPLRNTVLLGGVSGDPDFFALLAGLRSLQVRGLLTVRLAIRKDGNRVFLRIADGSDPDARAIAARTRAFLGMLPRQAEAEVVYGRVAPGPHQIAMLTRPVIGILGQVSAEIEVPPEDIAAGRTYSFPPGRPGQRPVIRVHHGRAPPPDTATAVQYGQTWFWIDDHDFNSKIAYMLLGFLMALAQGAPAVQAPVLTIPAG